MIKIDMDLNPTIAQLQAWIRALEQDVLMDLTKFWDYFATPVVIEELARIFATEGYGTWPPLSAKYEQWKSRHYPGLRMLRRQLTYYRAATRRGGAGNLYERNRNAMTFGIDLGYFANAFGFPYPAALEKGNTRGMPARPVFSTAQQSQILKNNLVGALKVYLDKTITKETVRHFGRSKQTRR